jgi:hypothetical protein
MPWVTAPDMTRSLHSCRRSCPLSLSLAAASAARRAYPAAQRLSSARKRYGSACNAPVAVAGSAGGTTAGRKPAGKSASEPNAKLPRQFERGPRLRLVAALGVYSAVPADASLMKETLHLTRPLEFQPAHPVSQGFAVKHLRRKPYTPIGYICRHVRVRAFRPSAPCKGARTADMQKHRHLQNVGTGMHRSQSSRG